MRKRSGYFCLLLLILNTQITWSQDIIDSLLRLAKSRSHDTVRIKALLDASWELRNYDIDTSVIVAKSALQLAEKIEHKKYIGSCQSDIGVYYAMLGNYPLALYHHFKALDTRQKAGDQKAVGRSYGNIGNAYTFNEQLDKAHEYTHKALAIAKKIDKDRMPLWLGNIGLIHLKLAEYDSAAIYLSQAIELNEASGNEYDLAIDLSNIASVFSQQGQHQKAIEYQERALNIQRTLNNKVGVAASMTAYGQFLANIGKVKEGEAYIDSSITLCIETGSLLQKKFAEETLSNLYIKLGKFDLALEHYIQFSADKDSLFNEQKSVDIGRLEANREYERMSAVEEAERKKELILAEEREKRQKTLSYSSVGGLLIVLVFSLFIVSRFRLTRRQKEIIEKQKAIVEEKQKEILDSIYYARRIQRAIITSEKYIEKALQHGTNRE
jgi:tetratricopeptide (TPR) repeat protein